MLGSFVVDYTKVVTSVKTHDNINKDSLISYVFIEIFNKGGPFCFCKKSWETNK